MDEQKEQKVTGSRAVDVEAAAEDLAYQVGSAVAAGNRLRREAASLGGAVGHVVLCAFRPTFEVVGAVAQMYDAFAEIYDFAADCCAGLTLAVTKSDLAARVSASVDAPAVLTLAECATLGEAVSAAVQIAEDGAAAPSEG